MVLIPLRFHFHFYENKDDKFLRATDGVFEKGKENKAGIGRCLACGRENAIGTKGMPGRKCM